MSSLLETAGTQRESAMPAPGWRAGVRTAAVHCEAGSVILPFDGRDNRAAEQYRIVRTKLTYSPARPRFLTVTSPHVADGKSVTAVNLGGSLALKEGTHVLLIDADLRRSTLSAMLDIPAVPGLADVLRGECSLEAAVVRLETHPGLYVLPSGADGSNPAELFDSESWRNLCAAVRGEFDYVVADTTPAGVVADYELVQAAADGVILVVRPDVTSRRRCYEALDCIAREKLLGVLLNSVPDWLFARAAGHGYHYYRGHDD
ncbi:MAG: CpsD/CapB family tyrosine-protein kinase [Acidobacteriota bacterium]|nr:CpsD/CapB family tyrosine-protein kinase [Acidobacteriota bacterium]